jgi:hypothetical protein
MMMNFNILFIMLAFTLTSCTDGRMSKLMSYGSSRSIECYSGAKLIYKGISTGKISSETQSDGYFFRDSATGKLMEVSGNCVIGK